MVEQDDQDLEKLSEEQLQERVRQLRTDTVAHQSAPAEAKAFSAEVEVGCYSGPPPSHGTEVLTAYRHVLAERCAVSIPGGIEPTRQTIVQWPALEQIFVDLNVRSAASASEDSANSPQNTPPESWLDAIIQHRRLVVLGVAGSGKTTLLRRLCLALASNRWQGLEHWPEDERDYLPLLVDMREFARWLAARPALPDAFAALLWTHISEQLAERNLTFAEDALANAVAKGQALMLVDNLQDVPQNLRKTVVDTLTDFAKSYHRCRLVITHQSAANRGQALQLPEKRFPSVTLMPLDKPRIEHMMGAWCAESPSDSLRMALQHPAFAPLLAQPLTLTLLLWLSTQHPPLAKQFNGFCIQAATALWQQQAGDVSTAALRILGQIALAAVTAADDDPAAALPQLILSEDALLTGLAELSEEGDLDSARRTLVSICSTGLLVEKEPATYGFLHPLLGAYVLSQPLAQDPAFVGHALKLAFTQRELARLLIPMACTYKVQIRQDWELVLDLLNTLCELEKDKLTGYKIWLAGDIVVAVGATDLRAHESNSDKLEQVTQGLTTVLEQDQLQPAERAQVGDILGNLGDPRFAEQRLYLPFSYHAQPETGLGFVIIRPGHFWMGSQPDEPQANPNELGNANPLQIAHPFWMARYPVTVAQYSAFIEAGGYVTAAWWRDEAAAQWLLDTPRQVPAAWTQQCWHPNWPVTGITWFEALAYSQWLDAQLRAPDNSPIPEDYEVRLPTEAEWEKAARSATRCQFPWGNDAWTANHANVDASGLQHPTPVGMYPQGATVTELFDMAGNVWEWTLSGAKKYPYDPTCNHLPTTGNRIVRGGSWQDPPAMASCMARRIQAADECCANIGLRLVLSVTRSAFSRYQLF